MILVVSAGGCRSTVEGRLLADALDAGEMAWSDVIASDVADALAAAGASGVAIVCLGDVADAVIEAAAADPRIVAITTVAAPVSESTVRLVAAWKEVPVFVVADGDDRRSLNADIELRLASTHPDSDLEIVSDTSIPGVQHSGDAFGSRDHQLSAAITAAVAWIHRVLGSVADRSEVVCTTDDGWEIHGSLSVPSCVAPVPVAILLHSGRSDRAVFARLERLLASRGVATLSIDWRGRGQSTNKGTYFELRADERENGWRDAKAALSTVAAHPAIDADRVAMIGIVHGAEHAVAASIDEPRVKALTLLTGYMPRNDREQHYLLSGAARVLYITSSGHGPVAAAMRELAGNSPPGVADLRVYRGGAIGYQLFDIDPGLEEYVATWVADAVSAGSRAGSA